MAAETRALTQHIGEVALIDQHVHGCWLAPTDRCRFENALNEANSEPIRHSAFDSQLGFALRAHCAPVLGLPKHADPQTYWERRSQFNEDELAKLFLPVAGVSDWLVDTGIGTGGVAGVTDVAGLSGHHAHEKIGRAHV